MTLVATTAARVVGYCRTPPPRVKQMLPDASRFHPRLSRPGDKTVARPPETCRREPRVLQHRDTPAVLDHNECLARHISDTGLPVGPWFRLGVAVEIDGPDAKLVGARS